MGGWCVRVSEGVLSTVDGGLGWAWAAQRGCERWATDLARALGFSLALPRLPLLRLALAFELLAASLFRESTSGPFACCCCCYCAALVPTARLACEAAASRTLSPLCPALLRCACFGAATQPSPLTLLTRRRSGWVGDSSAAPHAALATFLSPLALHCPRIRAWGAMQQQQLTPCSSAVSRRLRTPPAPLSRPLQTASRHSRHPTCAQMGTVSPRRKLHGWASTLHRSLQRGA